MLKDTRILLFSSSTNPFFLLQCLYTWVWEWELIHDLMGSLCFLFTLEEPIKSLINSLFLQTQTTFQSRDPSYELCLVFGSRNEGFGAQTI